MRTNFLVQLNGAAINGSAYACEGEQLARIIHTVAPSIGDSDWFVSDVRDQVDGPKLVAEGIGIPQRVGTTDDTLAWLRQVSQIVWGVCLAVPQTILMPSWPEKIWAETEPFRYIRPAILELRCFDSTAIYAFAYARLPIQLLADRFGSDMLTPETSAWHHYWHSQST